MPKRSLADGQRQRTAAARHDRTRLVLPAAAVAAVMLGKIRAIPVPFLAVDGNNAILVADQNDHRVRMIAEGERETTVAGSSEGGKEAGRAGGHVSTSRGHLLVADFVHENCVWVVEAAPADSLLRKRKQRPRLHCRKT